LPRSRPTKPSRHRVGSVSYYLHHGSWYIYYRDGDRQVRRRVAQTEEDAARVAAQVNSQLLAAAPTLLAFTPVSIPELRRRFLAYHDLVQRSSLATLSRYRAATRYLEDFAAGLPQGAMAHDLRPHAFVSHLRSLSIAPNGHKNTTRRPLRDKGVRYILECCRSMYGFAARMRHLPPYAGNPYADLRLDRMKVEDAKPVFVFDAGTELAFLQAADDWVFPVHFTLAKTGMRSGELAHLLVEDVDLEGGWLHVRNRPALGWRVKTGRDRSIPLIEELVDVIRGVIGKRPAGPVFLRRRYDPGSASGGLLDQMALARLLERRVAGEAERDGRPLTRAERARVARGVWRDAGAIDPDQVRTAFLRTTRAMGLTGATCPKSWRHTFATLLQDANIDPLIRQLTLGHQPGSPGSGALGMTAVYTHSRPETQRREILRALRLWPLSLQFVRDRAGGGGPGTGPGEG
jgi:integrase